MLTDKHIEKHLREWTTNYLKGGDHQGGGHSGMSLNIFCALLHEQPKRVAKIAMSMVDEVPPGKVQVFSEDEELIQNEWPKEPFWNQQVSFWKKYQRYPKTVYIDTLGPNRTAAFFRPAI